MEFQPQAVQSVNTSNPTIIIHISDDRGISKDVTPSSTTIHTPVINNFSSWNFTAQGYSTGMLQQMNQLRNQGVLTDVKICVETREFPCHKLVLASGSEFFSTMFQNRVEADEVAVSEISAATVEVMLQYFYTGAIQLTVENIQEIQTAAYFFRVPSLCKGCEEFASLFTNSQEAETKPLPDSALGIYPKSLIQNPVFESKSVVKVIQSEDTGDAIEDNKSGIVGPTTIKVEKEEESVTQPDQDQADDGASFGSYNCDLCSVTFRSKRSLHKHTIMHGRQRLCKCKHCGDVFTSPKDLADHALTHTTEDKRYVCQECGKSYVYPKSLKDHMKIHTCTDLYICSECGKSFIRADYLREHYVCHSGERPHKCETCGKAYSYRRDLSRHQLTHLKDSPFKCEICDRVFNSSDYYRQHKFTHTGERPYVCSFCPKSFFYRGDLHRHKRQVHGNGESSTTSPINDATDSKVIRLIELQLSQKNEKKYKCEECGKTFGRHDSLLGHMFKHTGKKRFPCDECDKQYAYKRDLVRHKSTHHKKKK